MGGPPLAPAFGWWAPPLLSASLPGTFGKCEGCFAHSVHGTLADVDGTLIHSVGQRANFLHKQAFSAAFKQVGWPVRCLGSA